MKRDGGGLLRREGGKPRTPELRCRETILHRRKLAILARGKYNADLSPGSRYYARRIAGPG